MRRPERAELEFFLMVLMGAVRVSCDPNGLSAVGSAKERRDVKGLSLGAPLWRILQLEASPHGDAPSRVEGHGTRLEPYPDLNRRDSCSAPIRLINRASRQGMP